MSYGEFVIIVNFAAIIVLLLLAVILLSATRFRSESGYVAAIIVFPTVPVYFYNMCRSLEWYETAVGAATLGLTVNTMLMPLLWLFTRRSFDPDFRMRLRSLLHFIPTVACMAPFMLLSPDGRLECVWQENSGHWLTDLNYVIILVQMLAYFTVIFRYLRKTKRYILDHCSDAEYLRKAWIPRFMALFACMFPVVMVAYAISPETDAWLIQILNVIAMSCLVFYTIRQSQGLNTVQAQESVQPPPVPAALPDDTGLQACSEQIIAYLDASRAYCRQDLSLAMLARETGLPQKTLSRSINTCLKCNFFELINGMRVEEAKRRLLQLEVSGYTIDSIYSECGFRSRSTFFLAFRKATSLSPAQWLKKRQSSPKTFSHVS